MNNIKRRRSRQVKTHVRNLFDWARERDLLADPLTRKMARRSRQNPAVAALLAELAGLGGRHDG